MAQLLPDDVLADVLCRVPLRLQGVRGAPSSTPGACCRPRGAPPTTAHPGGGHLLQPRESVEWPPSPLRLLVFSSRTGRWEEMSFLGEGDPMWAAVPGIPTRFRIDQPYSVYWQGSEHFTLGHILQVDDTARWQPAVYCILGFHPYKEVIFLEERSGRAIAFHWNSSKFQHLGKLYPKDYRKHASQLSVIAAFPYTPCWIYRFAQRKQLLARSMLRIRTAVTALGWNFVLLGGRKCTFKSIDDITSSFRFTKISCSF
ncbi:uncharacterized protein [Setaria viridis]|uniref:uncharacterized protein n=1 Tax=Setaria viridis TaxID=4556 RepID=UPI003B3AFF8F